MIYLLSVLTEHKVLSLDRNFTYYSSKEVFVGSRVRINFNGQFLVGFVLKVEEINDLQNKQKELGFKVKEISEIIDEKPIINNNLLLLAKKVKDRYLYTMIGVLNTMLPPSLRSETSFINKAKVQYIKFYELIDENYIPENKIEDRILNKFVNSKLVQYDDIGESKTLTNLISKNVIRLIEKEKYRYQAKASFDYDEIINLSEEQKAVLEDMIFSRENIFLLKGVTGSGKTIVYIKLIEDALKENKGSLILVPEVALTPLMISHIISYFKEEIAVLHSSLTQAERYDEYRKIADGKVRIVVGTRSAIFAPIQNLKYIIIDEEHDESYKQDFDLTYNAKDIALLRSSIEGAKVILGSATPSIDIMAKAKAKKIRLETLNKRYFNPKENLVSLIDFKRKSNFTSGSAVFSNLLINKIYEKLKKKEQIILMINKRGYSSSLICDSCGYVFKCPNCNLPLVYHKNNDHLMCHHCSYDHKFSHRCPSCGSINISYNGFGIEKVKEEFERIFKGVDYVVLDSDETPTLNQIQKVLEDFNSKKVQVLIGTQIVAKGHDFKDVSLVGIINADTMLNIPSYKANENTFSLLVQTIGRSGRFIDGEAIIQTYQVDNKVINYAINNDYDSFYNFEIKRRYKYFYPPFVNQVALKVCSKIAHEAYNEARRIEGELVRVLINDHVSLSKIQNLYKSYYSYNIIIKSSHLSGVKIVLKSLLFKFQNLKNIRLYVDLNPYDL